MKWFAAYNHLPGYLHRWCIIGFGRYMARIHRILDIDRTPYLHSHPFDYVSIVLWGGYDEQVLQADGSLKLIRRGIGSVVRRSANTFHRISNIKGSCTTLFLTRKLNSSGQNWTLRKHADIECPDGYKAAVDGIYTTEDNQFRKRFNQMWYAKCNTREEAIACERLSIHQIQT